MDRKVQGFINRTSKFLSFGVTSNKQSDSDPALNIPALPYDVWIYIAHFVPRECLRDLLSVNRAFFQVAMNERYAKIGEYDGEIWLRNSFYMRATLDCLRNPDVASRVRMLNIKPRLLQWASDKEKSRQKSWGWAKKLRMVLDPDFARKVRDTPGFTQAMLEALSGLRGVTEYEVDWRSRGGLPDVGTCSQFLASAWPVFGDNLQRLTITATMEYLETIVAESKSIQFKDLETLRLKMKTVDCDVDRKIMREVVAQFVNRTRHTLRHLSISASGPISLEPFLESLCHFPRLRRLELGVLFDRRSIPLPAILTPLLQNHASVLEQLTLRSRHATPGSGHVTRDWFSTDLHAIDFTALTTLELQIPEDDGDLTTAEVYVRPFSNTLHTLVLEGRALTFEDVEGVVDAFAHRPPEDRLRTLRMQVQKLSPELFDLLATRLPALEKLDLAFKEIVGGEASNARSEEELFNEMNKRQYRDWQLADIAIWHNLDGRMWMVWQWKIMRLLAECVPSIRSFREQGHMTCADKAGGT